MKKIALIYFLFNTAVVFGQQKDTLVYSSRREVSLEGTSNFRDLGGYPAADGRHVKWGHIYRSSDIGKLTDKDIAKLADLHVTTVCDFRGADEIAKSKDKLPTGAKWVNLPAGSETVQPSMMQAPAGPARDSMLVNMYSRTDHLKDKYKPMFDELLALDGDQSLLFHCTAGKDRTGIGAAFILSALGVDKNTILADYEATNYYWKGGNETIRKMLKTQGMDEKLVNSMLTADPAYLKRTFSAIDQKYGSMDKFLETDMGLTKSKRTALKNKYLN